MKRLVDYGALNASKANFDDVYRAADPRAYFRELGRLGYIIPHFALPIFRQLIGARRVATGTREVTAVDVGCSYGINAALLKYPFSYQSLRRRYVTPELQALSPDELLAFDRRYFASWPPCEAIRVIGVDVAEPAVAYARRCGVLDDAIVADLESDVVPEDATASLRAADIVLSTGCVGYVTHHTFERLLDHTDAASPPWIASFVLRMFPYDEIAAALRARGLETEKLAGRTFIQRRFRDRAEQADVTAALQRLNIEVGGNESDGHYHAELFVSRPAEMVRTCPLDQMLAPVLDEANAA